MTAPAHHLRVQGRNSYYALKWAPWRAIMKPADESPSRGRPARRGARTGRGPWLMLAFWIGAVAVLFLVGVLIRGM